MLIKAASFSRSAVLTNGCLHSDLSPSLLIASKCLATAASQTACSGAACSHKVEIVPGARSASASFAFITTTGISATQYLSAAFATNRNSSVEMINASAPALTAHLGTFSQMTCGSDILTNTILPLRAAFLFSSFFSILLPFWPSGKCPSFSRAWTSKDWFRGFNMSRHVPHAKT